MQIHSVQLSRLATDIVFFQNAGMGTPPIPIEDLPVEMFQKVINVNLVGPLMCTKEAVRIFKNQSPPGGK